MEKTVMLMERYSQNWFYGYKAAKCKRLSQLAILFIFSFFIVACSDDSSDSGESSIDSGDLVGYSSTAIAVEQVSSSALCPVGGLEIYTGGDLNRNGLLDSFEANSSQELCHREDAQIVAALTTIAEGSEACSLGGRTLSIGYDYDRSESLSADEAQQVLHFCDREVITGLGTSLYQWTEVQPGEECHFGGRSRKVGIDLNGNQVLEDTEVTSKEYSCHTNGEYFEAYDYCGGVYCQYDDYTVVLVQGEGYDQSVVRVVDDGIGEVTVEVDESAPDWLELYVSDYPYESSVYDPETDSYISILSYTIFARADVIPESAAGNTFSVGFSVSDGGTTIDMQRELKIVKPIGMSFDEPNLVLNESNGQTSNKTYVKVNFDQPLPADIFDISESSVRYALDLYELKGDTFDRVYSPKDLTVEWVGDDLYEGQTFATLAITVLDDLYPEGDEVFRIVIDMPTIYGSDYEYFFAVSSSFDVTIQDDGDVPVSATVSFGEAEVTEGTASSDTDLYTQVPYTINFSPALPDDGLIGLELYEIDPSIQDVTIDPDTNRPSNYVTDNVRDDISFPCVYGHFYYCQDDMTVFVEKGATEYTGVLYVKSDALNELDEVFQLTTSGDGDFDINIVAGTLTVKDDDVVPLLSFTDSEFELYATSTEIEIEVALNYPTYENVSFTLEPGLDDTAIQGVHYDFAISNPITIEPGETHFTIPLIIYGEEVGSEPLEVNFGLVDVSGASTDAEGNEMKVILDRIEPYYAATNDFAVPISAGNSYSGVSGGTLHMDVMRNVYKLGNVSNGTVIEGEVAQGNRDLYLAKFNLDGDLAWARQFGSSDTDYLEHSTFNSATGEFYLKSRDAIYSVSSEGVVTALSVNLSPSETSYNLMGVEQDQEGNTYFLISYSYPYSSLDSDEDGSYTNMALLKYDQDFNLLWRSDDFSDLEENHGRLRLIEVSLALNNAGVPFVIGRIEGDFLGQAEIGYYDFAAFRYETTSGEVLRFERFGSSGYDNLSDIIGAFGHGDEQLVVYYLVDTGNTVQGEEAKSYERTARLVLSGDGQALTEGFERTISADGYRSYHKTSDGKYFATLSSDNSYSSRYFALFDEQFDELVTKYVGSASTVTQAPIAAEGGGYYLVDANNQIKRITPGLSYRTQ